MKWTAPVSSLCFGLSTRGIEITIKHFSVDLGDVSQGVPLFRFRITKFRNLRHDVVLSFGSLKVLEHKQELVVRENIEDGQTFVNTVIVTLEGPVRITVFSGVQTCFHRAAPRFRDVKRALIPVADNERPKWLLSVPYARKLRGNSFNPKQVAEITDIFQDQYMVWLKDQLTSKTHAWGGPCCGNLLPLNKDLMNNVPGFSDIEPRYRFELTTVKYPDGKPILQVCVLGTTRGALRVIPLKQNKKAQQEQLVVVNPLFLNTLKELGTVIYFTDGVSTGYHTSAVGAPSLLLSNFL